MVKNPETFESVKDFVEYCANESIEALFRGMLKGTNVAVARNVSELVEKIDRPYILYVFAYVTHYNNIIVDCHFFDRVNNNEVGNTYSISPCEFNLFRMTVAIANLFKEYDELLVA